MPGEEIDRFLLWKKAREAKQGNILDLKVAEKAKLIVNPDNSYVFLFNPKSFPSCSPPQPPPKELASSSAGRSNLPHPYLWNGRPVNQWYWLCDKVYSAEDFLELSKQNADNRKKQKYHHKGGAKPFIQHAMKAHKSGALLSMIDNWGALHKDKKGQWINDVAQEKHDEMKKMQDEIREKLIQEAPECTTPDYIKVPLDAKFGIMVEKLGRKGRSIYGVGLKMLSTNFITLQKENEDLRAQLRSVLIASQGQTSTSSRGSNGVLSDDDYYDELANHNLDEN
ncbi:unnamed protein product [Prunus armeniaca]